MIEADGPAASAGLPHADETAAADTVPGTQPDPAARVLRQFRVVFNAVKSHFRQVEKLAGVGGAQLWALSVVEACPGIGVKALAHAMDIRQATASNLVRALVNGDLLTIERNGPDRRMVQLHLRPAGRALLRRAPGPFNGVLPAALTRLDPQTLHSLEIGLGRLLEELSADAHAALEPLAQL